MLLHYLILKKSVRDKVPSISEYQEDLEKFISGTVQMEFLISKEVGCPFK